MVRPLCLLSCIKVAVHEHHGILSQLFSPALNISSKLHPLRPLCSLLYIKLTSYEHHDIWKSLALQLFGQKLVQVSITESNEVLHYWPLVRGIHWWPVNSPHKGSVIWKVFLCHGLVMQWVGQAIYCLVIVTHNSYRIAIMLAPVFIILS